MSTLEFVTPEETAYANVLLYGPPKSGKTVGAASAPGPILFLNADRPNATRYAHAHSGREIFEVRAQGLDSLIGVVRELEANPGKYATVVVDTVGELYRTVLEDLSGRALSPKIQNYGDTGTHIERFCRALCELPLNTVLCLHELRSKDEDSGNFERLPYTGTNSPALSAKLMAMVDVIAYTGVVQGDDKEPEYLAQLIDGGGRRGGDRFGVLGRSRKVNLEEWFALIEESIAPKAQKEKE